MAKASTSANQEEVKWNYFITDYGKVSPAKTIIYFDENDNPVKSSSKFEVVTIGGSFQRVKEKDGKKKTIKYREITNEDQAILAWLYEGGMKEKIGRKKS